MKLLLDENLPHQLRGEIVGHDCYTVSYLGWGGIDNGALLTRAAAADFDALITLDAHLQYQQNQQQLPISIVVLLAMSNDMDDLLPLVPSLLAALPSIQPRTLTMIPGP
jgi:predicted nuclease of predicted toxin-antitoxin system